MPVSAVSKKVGATSVVAPAARIVSTSVANRPANAEQAAREHLTNFASYYRLVPDQVPALELRDLHDTGRGAIIARFGRSIGGIEVFGEQIAVAMDRNLDAVALTGYVTGDLPVTSLLAGSPGAPGFALEPRRAVVFAIADLTGIAVDLADLELARAAGDYHTIRLGRAATQLAMRGEAEPSRVKSVFFRGAAKQLLPAYYVETDLGPDGEGESRYFAYVISAIDGSVLWKHNLTAYDFTYRVYADNSGLFTPREALHLQRRIFNSAGLATNMGGGLGEGWADFHAMLITVRPEDGENPTNANWNGIYAISGYALGSFTPDPYYFGLRRFPFPPT